MTLAFFSPIYLPMNLPSPVNKDLVSKIRARKLVSRRDCIRVIKAEILFTDVALRMPCISENNSDKSWLKLITM